MIHIHPRHCRFSHILIFRLIYKLLDVIMRCISKPFHTCSCFAFVISNIVWLIWFECFDVNTEGSCLRVSRENPQIHFLFNQKCCCDSTRTVGFSWFSGGPRDLPLRIFFLIFALQCNVVILLSLHRYSEYWRPRRQSDCRYFGSYVIISIYTVWTISNILSQTKVPRLSPSMIWHLNVSTFLLHQSTLSCLFRRLSRVFDKTRFIKLNLCRIIFWYMSYLVILTSFQRLNRSTFDQFCK